jgi:hypothetical protein
MPLPIRTQSLSLKSIRQKVRLTSTLKEPPIMGHIIIIALILPTLRIIEGNATSTFESSDNPPVGKFELELSFLGMCTVHLKNFALNSKNAEIFQQILDDNEDEVLWTLWGSNTTTVVTPLISFHEYCSINIVLETRDNDVTRRSAMVKYIMNDTLFA